MWQFGNIMHHVGPQVARNNYKSSSEEHSSLWNLKSSSLMSLSYNTEPPASCVLLSELLVKVVKYSLYRRAEKPPDRFVPHSPTLLTAHLQVEQGKIHKSFMLRNGLFTLPAHTSASTEQSGPAPSRSGLKTTASIWSTSNTQSLSRPVLWSHPWIIEMI